MDQDGYAYDCWELCTKDTLKAVRFSPRKKMRSEVVRLARAEG